MHKLYDLKEMLVEELEHQAEKELTRESLELIDTLAHAGKNVCRLIEDCEKDEGGSYAMPDGSYDGSMVGYRSRYYGGGANGRAQASFRRSMARDSMGRYSRDGYSRGGEYAERLKRMADNLPENMRGEILRMAEEMKSAE